tara:strand:- start:262 stop:651 length:390 start_codon:yes stop_codon:yes gene_type:complete
MVKKKIMKNLIIDAANERIFFKTIINEESYTNEYPNNRENFDKFVILLFKFLKENKVDIRELDNIFVNQGPGKFSGIRTSISVAKALCFANKLNLFGFNSQDVVGQNYDKIIDLYKKGVLIKDFIKPNY